MTDLQDQMTDFQERVSETRYRIYYLLPAIYRMQDAEQGEPRREPCCPGDHRAVQLD
jgi:hypothetical protein